MSANLKIKLHKIKCIEKQEVYKDEIILWGIMVCNNNLFMVTPEIPERKFWEGSVKNFSPPSDLISLPLSDHDLQNNMVVGRAAVWIIERDAETFRPNDAYRIFHKLYLDRIEEIRINNPANISYSLDAFKDVLPVFHQKLRDAPQSHLHPSVDWWGNAFTDNDEIFPYIYTDFASPQFPPITQSETSPVSVNTKSAYGGQYEVHISWALEVK